MHHPGERSTVRRRLALFALALLPAAASGEAGDVLLPSDEGVVRYLARGRELAAGREWAKAADVLQRVVDGSPEISPGVPPETLSGSLLPDVDDKLLFRTARELAIAELAALPPEGIEAYRVTQDAPAQEAYLAANAVEDLDDRIAAWLRVADSYLVSSYGDDALERAADLSLDLGREQEALDLYRRILDVCPKDPKRDESLTLAKAAHCAARIGNLQRRDQLLSRLSDLAPHARVPIEGKLVPASELAPHRMFTGGAGAAGPAPTEWPMPGGDAAHALAAEDLPPSLPRKPIWEFRLAQRDASFDPEQDGLGFKAVRHDRAPPARAPARSVDPRHAKPYPCVRPVIAGGRVYYCDGIEYVARSVASGAYILGKDSVRTGEDRTSAIDLNRSWLVPTQRVRPYRKVAPADPSGGLEGQIGGGEAPKGQGDQQPDFEDVYRWLDYGGAGIAVADGVILRCERSTESPPDHLLGPGWNQRRPTNRALLYGLVAWDADDGTMLWSYSDALATGDPARERWAADRAEHPRPLPYGPGVPYGGLVYTLVSEVTPAPGVFLWCLDLRKGVVRFRTLLHRLDEAPHRLPMDSTIAVAGGVVYAVTHAGVVAAVEARPPGRLRWVRRYDRLFEGRPGSRVRQGFAINDPIVAGGKLIVAAADSNALLAIDAEDGTLAAPPLKLSDRASHVVGVSAGVLVVAGKQVYGVDLATFKSLWISPLAEEPWGRGFVGRTEAYIPSTPAKIQAFDLRSGKETRSFTFDVEQLGNLVYAGGRLLCADDEWIRCFADANEELRRIDSAIAERGEDAALRVERARLDLRTGAEDARVAAREDYRRAIVASDRAGAIDLKLRARAAENLLALARERNDLSAVDEVAALSGTPAFQALARVARLEVLARLGRGSETLAGIETFPAELADVSIPSGETIVGAAQAAANVLSELRRTDSRFAEVFAARVRERIAAARATGDVEALAAIPESYGRIAPSDEAWVAIAEVHSAAGRSEEACAVLRTAAARAIDLAQRGSIQLRLALELARGGHLESARREREGALGLFRGTGSEPPEETMRAIEALVDLTERGTVLPRLKLPLAKRDFPLADGAPVPIEGKVPAALQGCVVVAREGGYAAVAADGSTLWSVGCATPEYAPVGTAGEPQTLATAAVVAAARLCASSGDDLIVADVYGAMRIRAADGTILWKIPGVQVPEAMSRLRAEMRVLRGDAPRSRRLLVPAYALDGDLLVRLQTSGEVECFRIGQGDLLWRDDTVKSVPVGEPRIVDGVLVVGWSNPGLVRLYSTLGQVMREHPARATEKGPGVLLATPALDPRGRLFLMESTDEKASAACLRIVDSRTGEPADARLFELHSTSAAVLHVDASLAVFHDGGSRGASERDGETLHFLDWQTGELRGAHCHDLFGVEHLLRDGERLFVFTHKPAPSLERARLIRIDLKERTVMKYAEPPTAAAYARPLLTQLHVVVGTGATPYAGVLLFDRDATQDRDGPRPVFDAKRDSREEVELIRRQTGAPRYDVPPSLAVAGTGLVFGNPHGTVWVESAAR